MNLQWRKRVVILCGLAFGVYPEASVVVLVLLGLWLIQAGLYPWTPTTLMLLVAFLALRITMNLEQQSLWLGVTEGVVIALIARSAAWFQREDIRLFSLAMSAGFTIMLLVAAAQSFGFVQTPSPSWNQANSRATWQNIDGFDRATPDKVDPKNGWIERDLGFVGPGIVRYKFLLRATSPKKIEAFLSHTGVSGGQVHTTCAVQTEWSDCVMTAKLTTRALGTIGLGGYGSWPGSQGPIEIQSMGLQVLEQPTWLQRLQFTSRESGLTFNPNALGALAALVGVLGLIGLLPNPMGLFAIAQAFAGVFISGSRNALLTLLICMTMYMLFTARRPAFKAALTIMIVGFLGSATFLSDGHARFLNFREDQNQISRITLSTQAIRLSLQKPIFGFGQESHKVLNAALDQQFKTHPIISHSHNFLAQHLLERGVFGLMLAMALLAAAFYSAIIRRDVSLGVAITAIVFLNISDYFFYFAPIQIVFWLFWKHSSMTSATSQKPRTIHHLQPRTI